MRDKLRIVLRFGAKFGEALLAQWLERAAVNRKVTGSIPEGSVEFLLFTPSLFRRIETAVSDGLGQSRA